MADRYAHLPSGDRTKYALYRAATTGDWATAQTLLVGNSLLLESELTEDKNTVLHVACASGHMRFVEELLNQMHSRRDLVFKQNGSNETALCLISRTGDYNIARLLIDKFPGLEKVIGGTGDNKKKTALYEASIWKNWKLVDHLLKTSGILDGWAVPDKADLLVVLIRGQQYGHAIAVLHTSLPLAVEKGSIGIDPSEALADYPISSDASYKNNIVHFKLLFTRLVEGISLGVGGDLLKRLKALMFRAAEKENFEFLNELWDTFPSLALERSDEGLSVLYHAITLRQARVYNLLSELPGVNATLASHIVEDGNNMLHVAARMLPEHKLIDIRGSDHLIQSEILWYKEIEGLVPSLSTLRNDDGLKPWDAFLFNHRNLLKDGDAFIKQTATVCMQMVMMMVGVVFAYGFTVTRPDRLDPELDHSRLQQWFDTFAIAKYVATVCLWASMGIYLFVQKLRVDPKNYIWRLPCCMAGGLVTLLLAFIGMVISFVASIMMYGASNSETVIVSVFAIIATVIFVVLNGLELQSMVRSAVRPWRSFAPTNHLKLRNP